MGQRLLDHVKGAFASCCSGLKSIFLMRPIQAGKERLKSVTQCDITCDLSDKRTFFAWQRNHMSNERTFLAWVRTGISLIIFGFVIERFDLLIRQIKAFSPNPPVLKHTEGTHYVGITTFILGSFIILLAGWRFFYMRKHINQGESDFSTVPDIFLMVSILTTVVMVLLLFIFLH